MNHLQTAAVWLREVARRNLPTSARAHAARAAANELRAYARAISKTTTKRRQRAGRK